MIPILFPADAATYTTQGLGALSDAISCRVREERNGEFELEMQYPQAGLHFSEISDRCIILAIPSPWRAAQPFRIYRITKPLNGVCTIYARHITYDLSGIPVNVFSAQSAAGALSGLKANSATANPFEFWTDKQTPAAFAVSVPASIRSLLGGSTGSVLDVYGGEYEWDGWTVRLHEHRGTDRGVTIRYGKNLTDIEQDRNIANVRTGLYPYWADNDGNLVVCDPPIVNAPGSYDFINIQAVDFSQEWQEAPTPAQLKARAEQYIQANEIGVPTVSISVSFVDLSRTDQYKDLALLEQCDLCDTVTVQFEALGIDATAEVVSIETDVLLERYNKIEVGSLRTNIADTIVDNQQRTDEQIKQTASYLEDRIQQSTDLITNGGGYIYRKFDAAKNWVEIGSTDNLDLSKAIHVWRWNNGGFGHSGNGYNGPYRTAITQDGHIVANFIDAGTLTANVMRAGILQDVEGKAFYLDLPNGVLRMNATELSISGAPAASQSYAQQQAQAAQKAAIQAAAQSLNDYAETVTASLDDLQQQVDGQITTYFYDYKPTNDNAPASEWTTDAEKQQHLGDLFYVVDNAEYGGQAYRWAQVNGAYQWIVIEDTAVAQALEQSAQALDTADSKRRVFVAQPVPPYDVGDLWSQGPSGSLMVCCNARSSGSYLSSDWQSSADYINSKQASTIADTAVKAQTQTDIFNKLTNDGQLQGLYMQNGQLYINASYMNTGTLNAEQVNISGLYLKATEGIKGNQFGDEIWKYGHSGSTGGGSIETDGTEVIIKADGVGSCGAIVTVLSNNLSAIAGNRIRLTVSYQVLSTVTISTSGSTAYITLFVNAPSGNASLNVATIARYGQPVDPGDEVTVSGELFIPQDVTQIQLFANVQNGTGNIRVFEQNLEVVSSKTTALTLNAGTAELSSAQIDISGVVTFTDLQNEGSTQINGANINTGTISAVRIQSKSGDSYWDLPSGNISMVGTFKSNNGVTGVGRNEAVITSGYIQLNRIPSSGNSRTAVEIYGFGGNAAHGALVVNGTDQSGSGNTTQFLVQGSYTGANVWIRDAAGNDKIRFLAGQGGNAIFAGNVDVQGGTGLGVSNKVSCRALDCWDSSQKSGIVQTSFGNLRMIAFETPEPTFADSGSGVCGPDGTCFLDLDPRFAETLSQYAVPRWQVTPTSPGSVWVEKRGIDAIVHGEPGMAFDWMCMGPQAGISSLYAEPTNADPPPSENPAYAELDYLDRIVEEKDRETEDFFDFSDNIETEESVNEQIDSEGDTLQFRADS